MSSGINFAQYDAIPVARAGGGGTVGAIDEAAVPTLKDFASLGPRLPPFASCNLTGQDRMKYSVPTPIQRHTIPLSLAGHDVMACAQTSSGKTVSPLQSIFTYTYVYIRRLAHYGAFVLFTHDIHTRMRTHMHANTHTRTHTQTHTYTYMNTGSVFAACYFHCCGTGLSPYLAKQWRRKKGHTG